MQIAPPLDRRHVTHRTFINMRVLAATLQRASGNIELLADFRPWSTGRHQSLMTSGLGFVFGRPPNLLAFFAASKPANRLGSPIQSGGYGPFGENAQTGPAGFTGQQYFSTGGIYSFRNRFYNPKIGRFMQPDPIGYAGGDNLYAYVLNNRAPRTQEVILVS